MPPAPRQDLKANTYEFEQFAYVKPSGFREYDARWLFEKEINLQGIVAIGSAIGTMLAAKGGRQEIAVGHDFRGYSASIKHALTAGLMAAGCKVHDIGLCLTPMAYFAQFELDVPAVAMVTASHNENGWTGIKMGMDRPVTFGPEEMSALKAMVLEGKWQTKPGGGLVQVEDFFARYRRDLAKLGKISRKLKVAAVCGNGTPGAFAPQVLRDLGCEVVEIDCGLDHSFPNYNPNPEDLKMLDVMAKAVKRHGLDLAFGFDGDGDRCGVVDSEGNAIFADKVGLMLARDIAAGQKGAKFVVDVKSTGLFLSDPVLASHGASVDYWKTGHSYIKRRTRELKAAAGFEKSGHFFFNAPYGHGFDDGLVTAIAICKMLDRAPGKSMADLYRALPVSYTTPTMSPHCDDDKKYGVVDKITAEIEGLKRAKTKIDGRAIKDINTINGARFTFEDDSWGLLRASSNKPELVVVCESLTSEAQMKSIFRFIEGLLAKHPEVGDFNQKI